MNVLKFEYSNRNKIKCSKVGLQTITANSQITSIAECFKI